MIRILFLTGHIHRFQILSRDLKARVLPAPVFYAGSIECTSFAEKNEKKGYLILEFELEPWKGGILKQMKGDRQELYENKQVPTTKTGILSR